MKKTLVLFIGLCLVISNSSLASYAAENASTKSYSKDETVYVNLQANGSVDGIYVINAFESEQNQTVKDLGDYTDVKNLSDTTPLALIDGEIPLMLPTGRYYYQGNMGSKELPWSIAIEYRLDGNVITPDKLAGKSGNLQIAIQIDEGNEAYAHFYENYMLQMSYTLASDRCRAIESDTANLITTGNTINVGFTHAQPKPASYVLSCDVKDFEMGAITFRAVNRARLEVDTTPVDDMTDQFSTLADSVSKLADASTKLSTISHSFLSGLTPISEEFLDITTASSKMAVAIIEVDQAINKMNSESEPLKQLASKLSSSDDPEVKALAQGVLAHSAALSKVSVGTQALSKNYQSLNEGLQSLPLLASELQNNYKKINTATESLSESMKMLNQEVSPIPQAMDEKVDALLTEYIGASYTPESFAAQNQPVDSVTFIMKTPEITLSPAPVLITEEVKKMGFWEKLLDLFGL